MVGYTRVTLIITISYKIVKLSKSYKNYLNGIFYESLKYEGEIISNCTLSWYSEI